MPAATASQTIGPYWHLVEHPEWADLTRFGGGRAQSTSYIWMGLVGVIVWLVFLAAGGAY